MNYLAHLYLAGKEENLIIGNFIADHIKGKGIKAFSPAVREGILMHREIDRYTDTHPLVKKSIDRLRPHYQKYSGVIVDMFYDHFLAAEWKDYSNEELEDFTHEKYEILFRNFQDLPARSQFILPHMARHNWLMSYAKMEGLQMALSGLARRASFVSKMDQAVRELTACYECYKEEFKEFFPQLIAYTDKEIRNKL